MRLFDPWFFEEADARERERRHRIGKIGRLKEDLLEWSVIVLWLVFSVSVTYVPWFVGLYFVGSWLFDSTR